MEKHEEEPSPILKSWSNVYALVIGTLLAVMLFLYLFTNHFK